MTVATRPGTTDLAFSTTVTVQAPVGPHPDYLGGSCTFQHKWATSGITPVWRTPGEPGVRARVYADVRRPGTAR
ncbi:DUF6207 family protein [Streptomyces sp. NPDC045431]|uniref:DUF6207 family protein n=1 Tax=Streptomyces sp. NPDC045431 TaxID=3155613 RepID=UPI0033D03E8F